MKMHPCGSRKESSFPIGGPRSCCLTTSSKVATETWLQCSQKWWGSGSLCSCNIAQGLPKSFAWWWLFKMYFLDLLAFKKKEKDLSGKCFSYQWLVGTDKLWILKSLCLHWKHWYPISVSKTTRNWVWEGLNQELVSCICPWLRIAWFYNWIHEVELQVWDWCGDVQVRLQDQLSLILFKIKLLLAQLKSCQVLVIV